MTPREIILKTLLEWFEPEFSQHSETCFGVETVVDFSELAEHIAKALNARGTA